MMFWRRMIILTFFLLAPQMACSQSLFGESFCKLPNYFCIKVRSGETWESIFPNDEERDLVQRINRMNTPLRRGMSIAIPKNIERLTIYEISPFPRYIQSNGEKTIFVNQKQLAWGAYDEDGELLWWGPLSSGSGNCKGGEGTCTTPSGYFRVIRKQDAACVSTMFPIRTEGENGGAEMPYCMHFFRGYALHGSNMLPGYRASHGCIRIFVEDAHWLNEEFIETPEDSPRGTRIIID